MALDLVNLIEPVRSLMLVEIGTDHSASTLYITERLSQKGKSEYPDLLKTSAQHHNDTWLAREISLNGRLNTHEPRKKPTGGYSTVRVPVTAHETLAEGEYNRFYIRGLCGHAINMGVTHLAVYRAKHVTNPRSQSEALIGSLIPAYELREDLRKHHLGMDTYLGLPPGPNSGLSAKLP